MKKLVLALCVTLLLAGCAEPMPAESTAAPTESISTEPTQTEPAGLYLPDSLPEQVTDGAVRTYALGSGAVTELSMLNDRLLITADNQTLTLTEGVRAVPARILQSRSGHAWPELQADGAGLTGFDPEAGTIL